MFGAGNYCEKKYEKDPKFGKMIYEFAHKSCDSEIAIWDKNGEWLNFGDDTVKGYCTTNEVAKWINVAANATDLADIVVIE